MLRRLVRRQSPVESDVRQVFDDHGRADMDVDEYRRLQVGACTFESEKERWAEGQRLYLREIRHLMPEGAAVLDCACGDGVGLAELRALGFAEPVGVELHPEKAARARSLGFTVLEADMHDLPFPSASFDVVICSHTLEHALDPARVVAEFRRVLRSGGLLLIVLPFPDTNVANERIHVAKYALGTDDPTRADRVISFFVERGYSLVDVRRGEHREPELWLALIAREEPTRRAA